MLEFCSQISAGPHPGDGPNLSRMRGSDFVARINSDRIPTKFAHLPAEVELGRGSSSGVSRPADRRQPLLHRIGSDAAKAGDGIAGGLIAMAAIEFPGR